MAKKKKTAKPKKTAKKPIRRSAVRKKSVKPAAKRAARPSAKGKQAVKAAAASRRTTSWLDDATQKPLIDRYARQLGSFIEAMADGRIEQSEVEAQERRLVKLMREIEPQLGDALHARVTELLCELTAYDLMQMLYAFSTNRPQATFQG
ncbi:MAG: hypothetical protein HY718_10575 [Planctomycetes bacterium]|nr:hypothetical protein [Planctomycetota bacterium]